MAIAFGTADWAKALADEVNGSSEFRNAGSAWGVGFNGNVLLSFESGAGGHHLLIRLEGGACKGAEFVASADHDDAGFVLRAPLPLWRDVLGGKTLAATAILTGKLKVEGDKMTLLKHASAHRALLHCAASVDTDFPA